jgi:hypothetical protein
MGLESLWFRVMVFVLLVVDRSTEYWKGNPVPRFGLNVEVEVEVEIEVQRWSLMPCMTWRRVSLDKSTES